MAEQDNGNNASAKAAKCYWEEQVSGLSQKQLILMLYDGAIKFATEARHAIENKDYVASYNFIVKARNIVTELLRILNMEQGGDVAKNLQRLYTYMIGRLIEVNFTKEINLLDNVITILQKLRSAWAELDFQQALASGLGADSADDGNNGTAAGPGVSRQPTDLSRLLSVTA